MIEPVPVTVLIADDEEDVRLLVRVVLAQIPGVEVVGEAVDGEDALGKWLGLVRPAPHVMVLDNRMPNLSGLEVAERILERWPDQPIILFSAFLDDELRREAAELGILACVTKTDVQQLPALVRELSGVA